MGSEMVLFETEVEGRQFAVVVVMLEEVNVEAEISGGGGVGGGGGALLVVLTVSMPL